MTARAARVEDFWKKAFSRQYANRYERLGYQNLFCLRDGAVQFHGGISAIVGGNGVGKSTLAAALGELLETELAERFLVDRSRLANSELSGVIWEGDAAKNRTASGGGEKDRHLSGDSITTESWWLDPAFWAFHTRKKVVEDPNFLDVIEPLTPKTLDSGQLEKLSHMVGKSYENCLIYEVADYAEFHRFPYFLVRANGVQYGSEGMGQGELALMLIFWVLQDLRARSILILEEPESHVSPRSQAALMEVVAETAAKKGVWVIITTHSPTVVSKIPQEHLKLLVRSETGVEVLQDVRRHDVAAVLGGGRGFSGVALVEDETAKEFAINILGAFAPDVLRQLEIVPANGESGISGALKAFPKTNTWFRLIGIYDGDQRGKVDVESLYWPATYLPGETDPAVVLKSAVSHDAIEQFVAELQVNRTSLMVAMDALIGRNARDWIIELSRQITVTRPELVRSLFRMWIQSSKAEQQAREFAGAVIRAYDNRNQ